MTVLDIADGIYNAETGWIGMVREDVTALLAATFPARPPRAWFDDPHLDKPTPLTVSNDGRVHGHIATWSTSHIGMAGGIKPPKSKSRYAFFATGALETAEGDFVDVGQITLAGGHAPLEASVADAVAHYDNTQSAVMDVAVGEDRHGIWVAGALRPDVDEVKLRAIRASSVSGDWRPINGNLELVAVCSVNVPGFPIPRARVAGGQPVALVAAGTEELVSIALLDRAGVDVSQAVTASLATVDQRLRAVEENLLGRIMQNREALTASVDKAKELARTRRVRPTEVLAPATRDESLVASLRDRVRKVDTTWIDGADISATASEAHQLAMVASLRAKAHGLTATATSTWDTKHRKAAAKSGVAMPDGSFPIRDKADFDKAVHALGRAKNRGAAVRHIKKRGRALGVAKEKIDRIHVKPS